MIRLTPQLAEEAKQELLALLTENPQGLRTSQLVGTRKFHGARILSHRQIARLLREMPDRVEHSYDGAGYKAASWWTLKI